MSGWEKYVAQAAEALAKSTAHVAPTTHPWEGMSKAAKERNEIHASAVLAVVGPLIEEDTRDRMVTAAGAALEREGSFTQRERVAEEIAHAMEARRAHHERAIRRAEALGQPTIDHIASAVEFQMAANEAREIGRRS